MRRRGGAAQQFRDLEATVGVVSAWLFVAQHCRSNSRRRWRSSEKPWLARVGPLRDHVRRSSERVAVQRALPLCHILTIEGRAYQQWLPAPAA